MSFPTIGEKFYPGDIFDVGINTDTNGQYKKMKGFRLLFIKSGHGLIDHGDYEINFTGPILYCMNEDESISLISDQQLNVTDVAFAPTYINTAFSFDVIKTNSHILNQSDQRDLFWLNPFINKEDHLGLLTITMDHFQRIDYLINQISNQLELQQDHYWPCRTRSYLIELLFIVERCYMQDNHNFPQKIPKRDALYNKIILYLTENYMSKITLDNISDVFGTNRTTLNQLFKEQVGLTVTQYLIHLRIKMACHLLKNTALNVSEIVYRVGYNDIAHFNRSFKKITETTPLKYRENTTWF